MRTVVGDRCSSPRVPWSPILRTDPRFCAPGGEAYLGWARAIAKRIDFKLPDLASGEHPSLLRWLARL
jgi:hypothetical protein